MSINSNLRQLRMVSGMTQEQAAEKLGVTRQALSGYETGRTRPDLDMLMRLAEIYGTDLEGILYGQEPAQRAMRRINMAAIALLTLLLGLQIISSALLWCANFLFPVGEGRLPQEEKTLLESRWRLTGAWETVDSIILTIALLGFTLLLILILTGKCRIPYRARLIYIVVFSGGIILVTLPFALTDSVYTPINYFFTPIYVIVRMLLFFALHLVIEFVQRKCR